MNATMQEWTIKGIKDAVRATGSHWFDPDTMRFFGTRIGETVYQGPGGIYFVTSEKPPHGLRQFSVRQFTPPGDVDTIGEVASMSRGQAIRWAKELAKTPLEQQLREAMVALDKAVISNPVAMDVANFYRSESIDKALAQGVVYMNDGGYTRYVARQYDTGGFYLDLVETGATIRRQAWSDAYKLQREVCRVLWTRESGGYSERSTEAAERFKPVSEAEQFLHDCRKHGNKDATADAARLLMNQGRQHSEYMVAQCNGEWPYGRDHDMNDGHPQPVRICRHQIENYAKQVGAKSVEFGGDPRGCTVKLVWNDGETNDFGKEGWCVPGA